MAILKNTIISKLSITNNLIVEGALSSSNQTSIHSRNTSSNSYTTIGVVPQDTFILSEGITVTGSSSRFTVLEDGLYMTSWHNISNNTNTTESRTYIRINGVNVSQARGDLSSDYSMVNAMYLEYLVVGDYIELYHGQGQIFMNSTYNDFCIHRIY